MAQGNTGLRAFTLVSFSSIFHCPGGCVTATPLTQPHPSWISFTTFPNACEGVLGTRPTVSSPPSLALHGTGRNVSGTVRLWSIRAFASIEPSNSHLCANCLDPCPNQEPVEIGQSRDCHYPMSCYIRRLSSPAPGRWLFPAGYSKRTTNSQPTISYHCTLS